MTAGPLTALAGMCLAVAGYAQVQTGEIQARVLDPSGSRVDASATLTGLATGVRQTVDPDAEGRLAFSRLPLGRYQLEVHKEGFPNQVSVIEVLSSVPVLVTVRLSLGVSTFAVDVVGVTPLAGVERTRNEIPAPVQVVKKDDVLASGSLDVSDLLNRRMLSVHVNEIQGNPLQSDVSYRGYTASPLLGTPQGLSVYLDGVRLNQPFGDTVSWDLIPQIAVSEVALLPGSNPLFGLNTLGGAVSLRSKDGLTQPGTTLRLGGGSFGRKTGDVEHGGSARNGLHWYLAGNLLFEDGWRESSPSNVRQAFAKVGWQRQRTSVDVSLAFANNSLIGNGLQEVQFLKRDIASVYTKPDRTANRSPYVMVSARHSLTGRVTLSGTAYRRQIRTQTLNGDINEESLDQSLYQPGAAERAALAAAGYIGVPASGATAANTPFPFWRCLGNALLGDEPAEKCNGLLNRTGTEQTSYGFSGQAGWFGTLAGQRHQVTAGGAWHGSSALFLQSTELGYLNPDRSVTGVGVFGDGVTGGSVDGEPYDVRVDLLGHSGTGSVYATDTFTVGGRTSVTVSGRYNRTTVDNLDRIRPAAGPGSLTGLHHFERFNPAAGVTFQLLPSVNAYAGYTEGSRAPTSIELGCADPETPCKLPNAMAGDPPLNQVVTRTIEAGLRSGSEDRVRWSAGWFRATNRDDILFVASEQTGFGYFKNFGRTLRQGAELGASIRLGRVTVGGGYTFLDATFQSSEEVNGAGNSSNHAASQGTPGVESSITIVPGDRIPMIPKHLAKAYADMDLSSKWSIHAGMIGVSSTLARGNENNRHQPDGQYYVGEGTVPGYAVVNLGSRYQVHRGVQLFVQVNNLFDLRYYTAAQLGPNGFTSSGAFVARPFPAINGEFPAQHATFLGPGAPRGVWAGIRLSF